MISQRELERRYIKLMNDVETGDYYKVDLTNRVNTYRCGQGHLMITIDRDAGVTPMFMTCPKCGSQSTSAGYNPKDKESLNPTYEWFRPDFVQCLKMRRKNDGMLEHVLKGGLEIREIK